MHERLLIQAASLSDDALLARVECLATRERCSTVELIAYLAELDARNICLGRGRSLYRHCTEVLCLSEHAAYTRIGAARAARRFPAILDRLAEGSVNVTTVTLLAPHLTADNHLAVLDQAAHKTKDEVKEIVRRLDPLPPAKTVIRVVASAAVSPAVETASVVDSWVGPPVVPAMVSSPTPASAAPATPGSRRPAPSLELRAPGTFRMHVDLDRDTRLVIARLQDLLAREMGGDVSRIVARALRALLTDVEREKLSAVTRPRKIRESKPRSRHIPAAVRRAVWLRDGGRCAFVGPDARCPERRYLEWHHVMPYAYDGPATVENIALRCRAHNAYEAEQVFGRFGLGVVRETPPVYGRAVDGRGDAP